MSKLENRGNVTFSEITAGVTNAIIVPPYYQGTSFEDIVKNLQSAITKIDVPIAFIGPHQPLPNRLMDDLLDDQHYMSHQTDLLRQIVSYPNLSRILFLDFFNPGFDLIRYFHQQEQKHCHYGALLHGGSFLDADLYAWPWLQPFERAWAETYDVIYVPSHFLAQSVPSWLVRKVKEFPWGMGIYHTLSPFYSGKKQIDIIFPHRLAPDKGVNDLISIITDMPHVRLTVSVPQPEGTLKNNPFFHQLQHFENVKFIYAQSAEEHLETLRQAHIVISCAKQENFGYSMMKAIVAGCIPIAPNRLCYPEFIPSHFLYNDLHHAKHLIKHYLDNNNRVKSYIFLTPTIQQIKDLSFVPLLHDFFTQASIHR